ncbi:MAG: hypothetical protein ACOC27_00725 [Halanaerobium sp.]
MKKEKIIRIAVVFLFCFLIIIQLTGSRELFKAKKLLQREIEKQQKQNILLEKEYFSAETSSAQPHINSKQDLKELTAQVLAELKVYNLKLIDFSSAETELNLNLSGDFNSVLRFLYYLENEIGVLSIEEFKIKDDSRDLFFFIKLKKELI